jgi:hypothetical protein
MTPSQLLPNQTAYAVKNKWFADIPLSSVSTAFEDICLPLRGFRVPPMDFGRDGAKFRGITVNVPVGVFNPDTNKVIQFSYLVDFSYIQYYAMYEWMNMNKSYDNPVPESTATRQDEYNRWATIPVTVYLLDAYKKPIITLKYYDCWISHFGELEFNDYDTPTVITHSFDMSYSRFEIYRTPQDPPKVVTEAK